MSPLSHASTVELVFLFQTLKKFKEKLRNILSSCFLIGWSQIIIFGLMAVI